MSSNNMNNNTAKNSNIPKLRFPEFDGEWETKKLGEIGEIITGNTPPTSKQEYYNGDYLFVSPFDINTERWILRTKTTLTRFGFEIGRKIRKGSTLFVCIGSTIGKVGQADTDCITNQQINSVVSRDNNDNFIYTLLENHSPKIKMLAAEQAVPIINKTTFSKYILNLPSLPEQTRIASFFTSIDEKISKLKKKKSLLEQYKKGVMQQLFSPNHDSLDYSDYQDFEKINTRMVDDKSEQRFENNKTSQISGSLDYNENDNLNDKKSSQSRKSDKSRFRHLRFKKDDGTVFPNWERKKLGEVVEKKSSNISANKIEDNFGEYIIYGASGILKKIDFYEEENDYVSIIKDGAGVGRIFYCKGKSSVLGTMEIIKPKIHLNTYFMFCLLENIDFTKYITGSTIPHIYFKDYRNEECVIPSIEEQTKIANFLSALDDKIKHCQTQIENTETWKKGLLQRMFC